MNNKIRKSLFLAIAFAVACSATDFAQRNRKASTTSTAPSLLLSLPPSDAIALVNVRRVLDEALPKVLAENPSKLVEVNGELDKFKVQTGLDPRSFDQLALGLNYSYPSDGITKINTLAIARGTFNAGAIVAAGRVASGKYTEQKYLGKTIYVFNMDQQIKLLGLWDLKVRDLAVCALDANTIALGDPGAVRSVVDANKARRRPGAELVAWASRDPNALLGFGGNVSEALLQNLRISNAGVARELTAVRQIYGTLGMTSADFELMLAARTVDTYSAKNLGDTVQGLKQFGAIFINRLSTAKSVLARSALDNLKITTVGNELQIRTTVAQSQVAPLLRGN